MATHCLTGEGDSERGTPKRMVQVLVLVDQGEICYPGVRAGVRVKQNVEVGMLRDVAMVVALVRLVLRPNCTKRCQQVKFVWRG